MSSPLKLRKTSYFQGEDDDDDDDDDDDYDGIKAIKEIAVLEQ